MGARELKLVLIFKACESEASASQTFSKLPGTYLHLVPRHGGKKTNRPAARDNQQVTGCEETFLGEAAGPPLLCLVGGGYGSRGVCVCVCVCV